MLAVMSGMIYHMHMKCVIVLGPAGPSTNMTTICMVCPGYCAEQLLILLRTENLGGYQCNKQNKRDCLKEDQLRTNRQRPTAACSAPDVPTRTRTDLGVMEPSMEQLMVYVLLFK